MNVAEQMLVLSKLAQADLRLAELALVLREGPRELGTHSQAVAAAEQRLEHNEAERKQADEARLNAEREMGTTERRLEQSQANAKRVTTEAQMEASKLEIASLQRQRDHWEEEILAQMGRAEELGSQQPALRKAVKTALDALAQVEHDTPKLVEAAKQEGMALVQTRDELMAQLEPVVRRMYTVASQKGGNPLTTVVDQICQTCHTRVPPQYLVETLQERAIHECTRCRKIVGKVIYTPDDEE